MYTKIDQWPPLCRIYGPWGQAIPQTHGQAIEKGKVCLYIYMYMYTHSIYNKCICICIYTYIYIYMPRAEKLEENKITAQATACLLGLLSYSSIGLLL